MSKKRINIALIVAIAVGTLCLAGCNEKAENHELTSVDIVGTDKRGEFDGDIQKTGGPEVISYTDENELIEETEAVEENENQGIDHAYRYLRNNDFAELYKDKIKQYYEENPVEEYKSAPKFELIYFDCDDIPELLLDVQGFYHSIYTCMDGQIVAYSEILPYGAGGLGGYDYIPYARTVHYLNSDMAGAILYDTYELLGINAQTKEEVSSECALETSFIQGDHGMADIEVDFDNPHYGYYGYPGYSDGDDSELLKQLYDKMNESYGDRYIRVEANYSCEDMCELLDRMGSEEYAAADIEKSNCEGIYKSEILSDSLFEDAVYVTADLQKNPEGLYTVKLEIGNQQITDGYEEVNISDNRLEYVNGEKSFTLEADEEGRLIFSDINHYRILLFAE